MSRKQLGNLLDRGLTKLVSRKLFVFLIATVLIATARLDSEWWAMISMVYIGAQGAIDFYKVKHGITDETP